MCGSLYKTGDVVFLRSDLRAGGSYCAETLNSKQDRIALLTNRNHTSLIGQELIIDKVLSGFYCGFQYITYTVAGHIGEFSANMFSDYEERTKPSPTYISFYDHLGGDNNAENKI